MSKTTDQIIAAANDRAAEILRVYSAKVRTMHDAAAIAANALHSANGSKNVDNLYRLAATASAAANAAIDANDEAWTAAQFASEYVRKARRTAAAYKAAATRAGFTAEAIAKRDAAAEALAIIEDAYHVAEEERRAGNRAMNAAINDAREVIKIAKITAAAERAREIIANYPATTEDDAREIIRRDLDARSNDIDAAAKDWRRAMPTNEYVAVKVAAAAFASNEEQDEPTEATKNAARWADLAEQAAQDVETAATICDADAHDNRAQMYAAAAADEATRYDADQTTEQHAARAARAAEQARAALTARVENGLTEADTAAVLSSDYAETLTVEAIQKAGINPEDIAAEAMSETNEAMSEASEAEHKTIEAAIMYDAESAAAFAAEARRAADRAEAAAKKAACMDPTTADIVNEEAAWARAYADRATETAEQNAAEIEERAEILAGIEDPKTRKYFTAHAIAHQWSAEETAQNLEHMRKISAANAAALALLDAYAEAIGEHPTEDDDETRAAYRVARDEITGTSQRATEYDRETVDLITEAIARSARRPDLSKYESMPYLETGPAPVYQPAELLAYLGEPDDYDVEAIEAEATAYDTATGRRIWVAFGDDLAAIAERHQTATYYPAAF